MTGAPAPEHRGGMDAAVALPVFVILVAVSVWALVHSLRR
ncbi:hypothetical protein RKD19_003548 [Streptomyces canus]|nr:hypothetical protein [Streptomyces sp. SAI-090]MDH6549465.1 hypothetical protein [Streptomyces sp. SAI-041]MDH6568523.1 hypothetical protein [Streptomyces sp. SAI-117]MDH6586528.1 hypothetical protein [Streptomyces sp. SAI-133]MDH6618667.1 hypothetical protein [Streptomyces sp. SAI-135]